MSVVEWCGVEYFIFIGACPRFAMLLVEAPREAAVPPCAAPLDIPMSSLTKLHFSDYSAKVNKQYTEIPADARDVDTRLNYEQALASVARLNYEQSVTSNGKMHYTEQNRLAFDPSMDPMCDPSYILPGKSLINI